MNRKAFTLIELLVVISIISLLSSVVLASLNSARERGRIGSGKYFATQIDHIAGDQAVGMWDFDECSGTSAIDRSGSGNLGTLTNMAVPGVWSSDTPSGQGCSLIFDGTNDEVSVSGGDIIGTATTFTIYAWIKPSSVALETIFGEFTSNGDHTRNFFLVNTSKLTFDQWPSTGGSSLISNAPIKTGSWTHVAYVQDGSTRYLYIDGVLDIKDNAPEIYSGGTPTNARIGYRGSNQGGYSFSGNIDQVHVFSKALTAKEIGKIYASEKATFELANI